jgi:hypothetical protein
LDEQFTSQRMIFSTGLFFFFLCGFQGALLVLVWKPIHWPLVMFGIFFVALQLVLAIKMVRYFSAIGISSGLRMWLLHSGYFRFKGEVIIPLFWIPPLLTERQLINLVVRHAKAQGASIPKLGGEAGQGSNFDN